ncbi:unnamed protein product, partial [Didymodactylos carnosus]
MIGRILAMRRFSAKFFIHLAGEKEIFSTIGRMLPSGSVVDRDNPW